MVDTNTTPLPEIINLPINKQLILNGYDFSTVKTVNLNGGSLVFNSDSFSKNNFSGNINIGPQGGTIIIDPTGSSIKNYPIVLNYVDANGNPTNIVPDFRIDVQGIDPRGQYNPLVASFDGTNTIIGWNQPSLPDVPKPCGPSIIFAGNVFDIPVHSYTTFPVIVFPDGHNGILVHSKPTIIPCFLTGTMILTPNGEKEVENLQEGDEVITIKDNQQVINTITWVGTKAATGRSIETYPVKIAQNAFGEGIPNKDLFVTPEHCIFLNGYLIPARMLVNNASITVDKSCSSYQVYHIETKQHSILVANNTWTESFLNTGNKDSFTSDSIPSIHTGIEQDIKNWEEDAAAPLCTEREIVEPIFRKLEKRAEMLGFAATEEKPSFTNDTNLHLIIDYEKKIYPSHIKNNWIYFTLPASTNRVHLASRSSQPAQSFGPFVDDRRNLGVCISNIVVIHNNDTTIINSFLSQEMHGWNAIESASYRWTNGFAELPPLPVIEDKTGAKMLAVKIHCSLPYPVSMPAQPVKMAV